jgi:hypothetical protein
MPEVWPLKNGMQPSGSITANREERAKRRKAVDDMNHLQKNKESIEFAGMIVSFSLIANGFVNYLRARNF